MLEPSLQNKKTAKKVILIVLGMFALVYASFPIYSLFCKVTGYTGIPKVSLGKESTSQLGGKEITIRFNGDVMRDVPWKFGPLQDKVVVRTGENRLIFFYAENKADVSVKGVATFNVTPLTAAPYFNKVQCFCFNEQTLSPHEKVNMPVSFFVDPAIEKDTNLKNIKTITLSYTFFRAE